LRTTLDSTLPWWIAGPLLGLVITSLLALANTRFGIVGGVTDLVQGSPEGKGLRNWRVLLLVGIVLGGLAYTLLAGAPESGSAYSWLDAHLSLGGEIALLFGAGRVLVLAVARRRARGRSPAAAARATPGSDPASDLVATERFLQAMSSDTERGDQWLTTARS
jgi:hypothetical protein